MPKITISGIAHVFANKEGAEDPVVEVEAMKFLHGMHSDELCSDYFEEEPLCSVGVLGGRLRFVHDKSSGSLRISTSYEVPQTLSPEEEKQLVDATLAQWSDGIGSASFANHRGEILSLSLSKALLNSGVPQEDLGDLFLDPFPWIEDRDIRIEYSDEGSGDDEILSDLLDAAEEKEPEALVELGRLYQDGNGLEQDDEAAFRFFSQAADLGDPIGATFMAMCMRDGRGTEQNEQKAIEIIVKIAENDEIPLAMHVLGECYSQGLGLPLDEAKAVVWYRRGANLGDPGCMAEMGDCLEFGKGIEKNLKEALDYYQRAIEEGFDDVEEAIARVEKQLRKKK